MAAILRSPMTAVHVVTLLEEMPVQETADTLAELAELGLPVGRIIVNATRPALLTGAGRSSPDRAGPGGLAAAGLPNDPGTVDGLHAETLAHLERELLEARLRRELAGLGPPVLELPLLVDGVDRRRSGCPRPDPRRADRPSPGWRRSPAVRTGCRLRSIRG